VFHQHNGKPYRQYALLPTYVMMVSPDVSAGSVSRTKHDPEASFFVGRGDGVEDRQTQVRRQIQRASQAEHLNMRESTERRTEPRVKPELVNELEQTHQCDEE
jgi:hypothetical protein